MQRHRRDVINKIMLEELIKIAQGTVDALTVFEQEANTQFRTALDAYKGSHTTEAEFEQALDWFKQAIISLSEARFTLEKVQRDYEECKAAGLTS